MNVFNQTSANVSLGKRHSEGTQSDSQMKRVFESFYSQPKTMLMVEEETGIRRPNVCRYVAKWKKSSSIEIVKFGICPISRHSRVQYLTTNPALFPNPIQMNLF